MKLADDEDFGDAVFGDAVFGDAVFGDAIFRAAILGSFFRRKTPYPKELETNNILVVGILCCA